MSSLPYEKSKKDLLALQEALWEKGKYRDEDFTSFRNCVLDFYAAFNRPMPWRETDNPWHIAVSEIMLQQT